MLQYCLQGMCSLVIAVYSELLNCIKFCIWGARWVMTNFLSVALWVIFDQVGNVMVFTHRVHHRLLQDTIVCFNSVEQVVLPWILMQWSPSRRSGFLT